MSTNRRVSWPRALFRAFLALLVSVLVIAGIGIAYLYRQRLLAHEELAAAVAVLDAQEPDWRMDRLLAKRPAIAPEDNGALLVNETRRRLPKNWNPKETDPVDQTFPQRRLWPEVAAAVRKELEARKDALDVARKTRGYAVGRYAIEYQRNFMHTLVEEPQNSRAVVELLRLDAIAVAEDEQPERACESIESMVNIGRYLDEEPYLIATLIRIAFQSLSTRTLERTLAQGVASEESLAKLQKMLADEAAADPFVQGLRGERAGMHDMMDMFGDSGVPVTVAISSLSGVNKGPPKTTFWDYVVELPARKMLDRSHALILQHQTKMLETMKLPAEERYAALRTLEVEVKGWRDYDQILARLLIPAISKVGDAEQRVDTMLHCAVAGIAAERFRLKNSRWPTDLDEVVKAGFLAAVPEDLFDGKPLRFRRAADGIVIHSVGKKGDYAGDALDRAEEFDADERPIEFRLWDPASRRQPPLPPKVEKLDDAP